MTTVTEVQKELENILQSGSFLLDTSGTTERDLKNLLLRRLTQYHQAFGSPAPSFDTVEDAQLETARCALHIVERAQFLLDLPDLQLEGDLKSAPAIGTRDLKTLRTLLSLIFRWGTETLYTRLTPSLSSKPIPGTPKIIDLTNTPADHAILSDLLLRLMGLLFPNGPKSTPPQTLISSTLLKKHAVDLLRPSMALGWLPSEPVEPLRPLVIRLLALCVYFTVVVVRNLIYFPIKCVPSAFLSPNSCHALLRSSPPLTPQHYPTSVDSVPPSSLSISSAQPVWVPSVLLYLVSSMRKTNRSSISWSTLHAC